MPKHKSAKQVASNRKFVTASKIASKKVEANPRLNFRAQVAKERKKL